MMSHPGTPIFSVGPENLASQKGYTNYSPVEKWDSEAYYPGPDFVNGRQGYGHYLNNLNFQANLVGFGVAQSSNGKWFYTLELAYSATQPSKTVDEALAEYVKPQSADPVTASAVEGTQPSLPSEVNVNYTDGSKKAMPVSWNSYDWSGTKAGQSVKLEGTVTGTTVKATATISITKATAESVDNPTDVTTKSGVAPQLPETAVVHYSNRKSSSQPVQWAAVDKASYSARNGGEFTVSGTVEGLPVQVKVIVEPATTESVEPLADITIVKDQTFTAPTTANVTYSNGEKVAENITWANLDAVKANEVGDYTINGTAAGLDVSLTVHVVAAKITSVTAPDALTVESGTAEDALGLPSTVSATFDNGTTSDVDVTWPALDSAQKATLASRDGGTITLAGKVQGWDQDVPLTITVKAATITSVDIDAAAKTVTTKSGTAPQLATEGNVHWSNGEVTKEKVNWDAIDQAQYSKREGGEFDVNGTLHGEKVTTHVTVEPATVSTVAKVDPVSTDAKVAPKLPATVDVTWSNGEVTKENVSWNISESDYATRGSKEISGTVLTGTANEQSVAVTLTVSASITKVEDPQAVTTPSGTDPAANLPTQVTVTWSDDVTEKKAVTWPASTKEQYTQTKGGSYTLTGTVEGTSLPATITVNVEAATLDSVDNPEAITVPSGIKEADLKLPATVVAHYSDGNTAPVAVTWDALTDDQKVTLAATAEGSFTVAGKAEGKDVALTVNVTPATITSVDAPADIDVASGTAADALPLPTEVTVHWSNGAETKAAVTWSELTDGDKAILASITGGSFTLTGDVAGYTKPQARMLMRLMAAATGDKDVTINVNVTAATPQSVDPLADVTTKSGVAPQLPEKATVTWSGGQTTEETVTWDDVDKALYSTRTGNTFEVNGLAASLPVKVTVTVEAATVSTVTAEKDTAETYVGEPVWLPRANVTWSNGDTDTADVSWGSIEPEQLAAPGEFTLKGTAKVDGQEYEVSVKVVVKAKEEPTPEPTPGTDESNKPNTEQPNGDSGKATHGEHTSKGKLPLTGANAGILALLATALVGAGVVAVRAGRRTH